MFWLSFIYLVILAVAAVGFAVLQIHFPVLLLGQNNLFAQKKVCSKKKVCLKNNFVSLRRCQAPNMCQMTFLSSIQVPKKISPDVDRRAKVRDAMGWNKTISAQRKALCDRKRKFSIFKETNINQVVRTSVFKVKRNAFKEVQVLDEEVDDPMPI